MAAAPQYFPTHSRTHSAVGHSPVIGLGTINETSFAASSIPPYEVDPRTAADAGAPVSGMYARNGLWDDEDGDDAQRTSWRRRLSTSTNHTSAGDRRSTKSTRSAATSAGRSRSGTLTNAVAAVGAPSGALAQQQQQQSEPWAWGRKSHAASLSSGSANLVAPTAHSRTSSGVAFPGGPRAMSPMFSSPPPPPMAALASPPMPMPSPYGMHSPHASIHSPALSVFPGSSAMPSPSISSTGATTPTIPVQPELKQKKSRTRLRSTTGKRADALPEHDLNTPMAARTPLTPIGNVPPIPPAAYPSPYSAKGQTMHPKADGKSAWKRGVEKLWRSKSSSGLRDSFHHKRGTSENDPPPPMPALPPRNTHATHQSHSGTLGLHSPRPSHSGALGFATTADLPLPPAFGASHRDSFDDFGMRPPTARYDTFGVALPSTPEPFEPNDNAAEADPFASAVDFAQSHSRQPSRALPLDELPLDLLPPPTVGELSRPPSLHNLKAAFIPRLRKSKSMAAVDGSISRPVSMDIPRMPSPRMPTASLHGHGAMSEAHFGAFSDIGHADPLPSLSSPLEIVHLSHDRGSAAFASPLDFIQRPEFATQTFGGRSDQYSTFGNASRTLEPPRPHFHNHNSLDLRSQDQVSSSPSAEPEPAPIVEAEPPVPPIRTKPRAVDPPMPDPMAPPMSAPPRSHSPPCSLSIKTDFSGGRVGSSGSSAELATPHQPTSAPPTAAGFEPFNEIPISRARSESLGVDEPPTSPSFYELYEQLGIHPNHIKENRKPKQFPDMDDAPDDFNTDDLNHFNQHFNAAFNDAFLPTGGDGFNPLDGDLSPSLRSSSWEAAINAFPTIDDSMAMATGPSLNFDDIRANRESLQSSVAAIAPTESVGSHSYAMHESSGGPQQRANPGRSDAGGAGAGGGGGQGGGSGASSENTSGVWTSWRDVPRRTGGGSGQTSGLGGSGRDSRGSSRGSSRERRVPPRVDSALDQQALSDDDSDDSDFDDDRPLSEVVDDVPLSRLHPQASAAQQQRFADKQRRREARRAERERMLRRSKTRLTEAKPASPAPAPIVRSKSTRDPREHRYHSESQPRTRGWDGEGGIPPDLLAGRLERVAIGTPPTAGNLLRVRNPDARQPSPGEPIPRPSSADPGPHRARVQSQQNHPNPLPRPPKSPARQGYLTLPADDDRPENLMPSRGGADMQRRPSSGRSAEHQSSTGHGSAERHSSTSHGGGPHDHSHHHGYRVASDGDAHLRRQPTSSSRSHRIASEGDQPRSGSPLVVSNTSSPNATGQPVSRGPSMNAGRSPVPSRPRSHSNAARHHPGASAPTPPSEPIPHRARPVAVRCLVLDKRGNSKTLPLDVYPETTARDVVAAARACGDFAEVMTGPTSGWVVFEIFAELGIERQVRDYESILAVTRGWDPTATKNCLVIKDTMRGIASWARGVPNAPPQVGGWVHLETKRGKWSKRWLETRGGQIFLSKNEKGKDEMQVNTLFSDTYSCPRSQTAPMPYVFAFKRFEPAASFENPNEHVQYVACDDPTGYKLSLAVYDARSYTIAMTNPAARQPQPSARPAHAPAPQHQQQQPQQQQQQQQHQQRPQRPPPPGGHLIDLYGGHQAFTGKGLLRTHPGGPPVRPS